MRIARIPTLLPLLLVPATLLAQPAADASVSRHVAYLLDLAQSEFRGIRGAPTYGHGTSFTTTGLASAYPIRFQGADAPTELRVNADWNILHVTTLRVAGDRAAAAAAWAQVADSIAAVIPAGWRQIRTPGTLPHASWLECDDLAGRQVTLQMSLPFEAPALLLIVYKFKNDCP
ncbi:MAG TPA: hypothetical protein VEX86_07615 [Longimicrobium sp.]|nr:hypothetical protein [Longimicrobium sp.]